jgi:hypothetical protein
MSAAHAAGVFHLSCSFRSWTGLSMLPPAFTAAATRASGNAADWPGRSRLWPPLSRGSPPHRREHPNRWASDLRQRRYRKLKIGEKAGKSDGEGEQRGRDWPLDEGRRKVHPLALAALTMFAAKAAPRVANSVETEADDDATGSASRWPKLRTLTIIPPQGSCNSVPRSVKHVSNGRRKLHLFVGRTRRRGYRLQLVPIRYTPPCLRVAGPFAIASRVNRTDNRFG